MSRTKVFAIASCLAVLALAPARADEWNKKSMITVRQPIALPNTVLQPGTYTIQLSDSIANRHVVQVFNEDGELVTTATAIPTHQMIPPDNLQFSFYETPPGRPPALRAWFWPGESYGDMFAYPPEEAIQIAQAAKEEVPVAPPPAPAPAPAPEQPPVEEAPAPAPAVAPPALPVTASPLPLFGLLGLASAAAAMATRTARKRG